MKRALDLSPAGQQWIINAYTRHSGAQAPTAGDDRGFLITAFLVLAMALVAAVVLPRSHRRAAANAEQAVVAEGGSAH
ncbi:MAG TPA: hypothetical protein VH256_00700 [Thermoleophilaceae bacterium]|jgi:hypothetical protein|nr:hypothetical protein [Thermoleophilaceae bacterium]